MAPSKKKTIKKKPTKKMAIKKKSKAEFKFPTRAQFLESCQRQNFSLPLTMMHYIWENPKTQNGYKNLSQSCKTLFLKNPILLADSVDYSKRNLSLYLTDSDRRLHLKLSEIKGKLWITDKLYVSSILKKDMDLFCSKVIRCDAVEVYFEQDLTYKQLKFFGKAAKKCTLARLSVKNEDGPDASFVEEFAMLPKIEELLYVGLDSSFMPDTVERLIKVPHFLGIRELIIRNVPEGFNIELLNSFMKANKMKAIVRIEFTEKPEALSDGYKQRLKTYVNAIIQKRIKDFDYMFPEIHYNGLDRDLKWSVHMHAWHLRKKFGVFRT